MLCSSKIADLRRAGVPPAQPYRRRVCPPGGVAPLWLSPAHAGKSSGGSPVRLLVCAHSKCAKKPLLPGWRDKPFLARQACNRDFCFCYLKRKLTWQRGWFFHHGRRESADRGSGSSGLPQCSSFCKRSGRSSGIRRNRHGQEIGAGRVRQQL